MTMDPLGLRLFSRTVVKPTGSIITRSDKSVNAKIPAPGYGTLAANLLAKVWNESPDLQNSKTPAAVAKKAARKFSKSLVID